MAPVTLQDAGHDKRPVVDFLGATRGRTRRRGRRNSASARRPHGKISRLTPPQDESNKIARTTRGRDRHVTEPPESGPPAQRTRALKKNEELLWRTNWAAVGRAPPVGRTLKEQQRICVFLEERSGNPSAKHTKGDNTPKFSRLCAPRLPALAFAEPKGETRGARFRCARGKLPQF